MILKLAAVAVGGFLGGMLRLLLSRKLPPLWGTLTANTIASFLLAFSASLPLRPITMAGASAGLCGALSTWSTLSREVGERLRDSRRVALVYLSGTLLLGALAAWAGSQFA